MLTLTRKGLVKLKEWEVQYPRGRPIYVSLLRQIDADYKFWRAYNVSSNLQEAYGAALEENLAFLRREQLISEV